MKFFPAAFEFVDALRAWFDPAHIHPDPGEG